MAFLAVLREGFETAVFLLAAAQTSHGNRWFAVSGGATGILASIAVGVGLYFGGLKLNLARFFRVTGVFLVLIAAGLVMGALRTAHEAGWLTIGQQQVLDFSSWMPSNSVQGALITGVFGIRADPRLIEVLGWLLYTVPVLVVFLWPAQLAAAPRTRRRMLAATCAALLIAAAVLAIMAPAGGSASGAQARTVIDRAGHTARVSLASGPQGRTLTIAGEATPDVRSIALTSAGDQSVDGVRVLVWQGTAPADAGTSSPTVTLEQLLSLTGGRLPVGVSVARTPGPFQAQWAAVTVYTVLAQGNSVVSAQAVTNRTAVLTGGGLTAPKTVSIGGLPTDWSTTSAEDQSTAAQIAATDRERAEHQLWKVWLPLVLAAFALACALGVLASVRGGRTEAEQERKSVHGETHRSGQVPV
jgi:high-affinity iron transporter